MFGCIEGSKRMLCTKFDQSFSSAHTISCIISSRYHWKLAHLSQHVTNTVKMLQGMSNVRLPAHTTSYNKSICITKLPTVYPAPARAATTKQFLSAHSIRQRAFGTSRRMTRTSAIQETTVPPPTTTQALAPATQQTPVSPTTLVASAAAPPLLGQDASAPEFEQDQYGVARLVYKKGGWSKWRWQDKYDVNYVKAGESGPPIVLVHGFGASAYHWRYNLPELAKNHRVYCIDLLGFGFSDKPVIDYNTPQRNVWADEIVDFIKEVVQKDAPGEKVVLAGNSLGGYNVMSAASQAPELVRGLVVLNGAGRFEDPSAPSPAPSTSLEAVAVKDIGTDRMTADVMKGWLTSAVSGVSDLVKRVVLYFTFMQTKQPSRILTVLKSVYVSPQNVDDTLVQSIVDPAQAPDAATVFYKVISGNGRSVNNVLASLPQDMPLLLLWGDRDPWITPSKAAQVMQLYPTAEKIGLNSGHCPHDDSPSEVNEAMLKWVGGLPAR